jgi:hypothetical protein
MAIERMERQVQTLQAGLASGRVAQDNYAASLREIKRQYAALTGGSIQKASAEVERFARASREAASARLDESAREGFERVAASVDRVFAATQRYEQQLAAVRAAEDRTQATAAEAARIRERLAQQYQKEIDRITGVSAAKEKEARAEQNATRAREQAAQAFQRFNAQIDPAVAAQQRFANAQNVVNNAVRTGAITKAEGVRAMAAYRASLSAAEQAVLRTGSASSILRNQFLATANSIAILDGPLGGIASRFSAFGVLIGRTGLLVGGALVAVAAFGAVLNRGIRNLSEWEAANARVNAILQTTGNQAGLTGEQIRRMTSQIAVNTLETEQSVMAAAQRLLTFRDIAGSVFEDVLKAATDMAALGFGTVESETVKLAKALEDPAQALTSLSRAGIVFTRQQRQVIVSLVESGRQAEAMERILGNVNARVGGAAEAAARDTLAGAFDTISQAAGRAVRDFAAFVVETTALDRALKALAVGLADYAGGPETSEQELARRRADVARLRQELQAARELEASNKFVRDFGTAALERGQRTVRGVEPELAEAERLLAISEERVRVEEQLAAATRARQMVSRDTQAVSDLATEIDLRRQLLGLSEDEQRLQRSLAQLGLRGLDIAQRVSDYEARLRAAGTSQAIINELTDAYRDTLKDVAKETERARDTAALERQTRAVMSNTENLRQQVELMHLQVAAIQSGATESEARAWAEEQVARRMAETLQSAEGVPEAAKLAAAEFLVMQDQARLVKEQLEAAAQAANMQRELENTLEGLQNQLAVLDAQIELLEQGVDFSVAQRLAEIEVAKARVETLIVTEGITAELEAQLATLNAMSGLTIEIAEREARVSQFRPARGGGGGGGRVTDIQETIDQLNLQIERERQILGLERVRRTELEIFFQLQDANARAQIQMSDDVLRGLAAEIAAKREALEVDKERQQLVEDLAKSIESQMERAFMSMVDGTKSAKDAFRDMARSILAELYRVLVVQRLVGMVSGPIQAFSQAVIPSANGNAFQGGNVVPFANGGVVSRPTLFPMMGGRTGLMGEAGPEAIMPLKRGRDGKLGVQAESGNTVHIVQNFSVAANGDESVKRIVAQQVPAIAEATKAAVIDARQRGGKMRAAFR